MSQIEKITQRIIAYVDGFNLYHGICEAELKRYLWLNIPSMCKSLLRPHQSLIATKYFTSRVSRPPERERRQTTYLEALQTLPDLLVYEGKYEGEVLSCNQCGFLTYAHSEKMTDVNIAVEITKDAHADRFDAAMIVTGDGDQVPTILMVRELFPSKRIIAVFPPKRVSSAIRKNAHVHLNINSNNLRASQLPDKITKPGGVVLSKPPEWQESVIATASSVSPLPIPPQTRP